PPLRAQPEDPLHARVREALNPFAEQALGRLTIEIGIRPTYPAEFIIVRIGIWPGGAGVTEGWSTVRSLIPCRGESDAKRQHSRPVRQLQLPCRDRRNHPGRLP